MLINLKHFKSTIFVFIFDVPWCAMMYHAVTWRDTTWRGDARWHDLTRRKTTWHDVTRRDMAWRDMMWNDVIWRNVTCVTRRDTTWHDVAWRDVTWREMTWHDVKWRDMTWHDVTWCDMMWYDGTWRDMTIKLTVKHWSCGHHTSFRAIAYKFRAFLSRNECLGNFENLLNRKVTWIFEVPQTR